MTLEERKEKALQARRQGFNCAQSVMLAFPDRSNLPADTMVSLSSGLGSGVGGSGEICGVILGMALIEGLGHAPLASEKAAASKGVRRLSDEFCHRHGCLRCKELKAAGKPCDDLVLSGVEILHEKLAEA